MRQELGALLPLDIENAFPAVSQQFLFEVIKQAGLQAGLANVIQGCYLSAAAFASFGGAPLQFLFWLLSGIMQGSSLSGSMFALAFDPLLRELQDRIDKKGAGLTRACADDVIVL